MSPEKKGQNMAEGQSWTKQDADTHAAADTHTDTHTDSICTISIQYVFRSL